MRSPVHRRRIGANPLASAMTPMIDVVFLLLVFFLCTASFEQPEEDLAASLVVETSSAAGGAGEFALPEALDEVNVTGRLTPGGVVWSVNDGPTVASPAELARLLAQLAAIDRGLPVTIDSGPKVPLADVVQAYDASRVAGFGRVLLMASPLPSERTPE